MKKEKNEKKQLFWGIQTILDTSKKLKLEIQTQKTSNKNAIVHYENSHVIVKKWSLVLNVKDPKSKKKD